MPNRKQEGDGGVDFVIQASSRTWAGGRDICMDTVDDCPVVMCTLKRSQPLIASPNFTGSCQKPSSGK